MRKFGSRVQMMDLMEPWWSPAPISYEGQSAPLMGASGLLGRGLVALEMSKTRSFLSWPPVASTPGRGPGGKATARTM